MNVKTVRTIASIIVGCLSVPSVIFWTKVPNLQGLLGRV